VESGAGDDVIDGGADDDFVLAGPGNDVVRGGGGFDRLSGDDGNDRVEGGSTQDDLSGGDGDDVLVGGAGRDKLSGDSGSDRLLARDGEVDAIACAGARMERGDRATADADDSVGACREVRRAGSPRLELHALIKRGNTHVLVASCPSAARAPACTGRMRFGRGRTAVTRAIRVAPGRRAQLRVTLPEDGGNRVRLVLRTGQVLHAWLSEVDP